jgi:hypothetical protein
MKNTRIICDNIESQAYYNTWAYASRDIRWRAFYNVWEKVEILTMSGLWNSIRHQILEETREKS